MTSLWWSIKENIDSKTLLQFGTNAVDDSGEHLVDLDEVIELTSPDRDILDNDYSDSNRDHILEMIGSGFTSGQFETNDDNLCKNCHGKGEYMGDLNPDLSNDYGEIECEVCNGTGLE